ncbi:MAG: TonB-dependent receptor [Saccharospirillaceae bacterium]|nr:TonB-dependent receptor [Saccharospirillaceae bacterium]MCD8532869.1 TonB-dependent receptor [Saccharospirillaceae bacterium]
MSQPFWLCLLWLASLPAPAANGCFYDGVSQTTLSHIIQQVSQQYQLAVLTRHPQPDQIWLAQPLGDCSLTEFLNLVTSGNGWHYRQTAAGVVLFSGPQAQTDVVDSNAPEEVIVTGVPFLRDPLLASRYNSNTLSTRATLSRGQLAGNHDLTSSIAATSAVAFSQEAGMDRNLSIRGLDADFTRVLVNGMPMLVTGTSIDARGAVNNSRSFDFDMLPQGLFTQVELDKSGAARSEEGAIAGSVDLRTPLPLDDNSAARQWFALQRESNLSHDGKGFTLSGGLQGIHDQAEGGNIGWLLGLSYRTRTTRERGFSTVRWQTADWGEQSALTAEQQAQLDSGDIFYPRHNRYDILDREQISYGVNSALQWHDSDWGDFDLTAFWARSQQTMHEYHISSAGLKTQDLSHIRVNDFETNHSGMVYGDFSGVDIRSEHNYETDQTRLGQLKFDWYLPLSERVRLHSALGYQRSDFNSPDHDKVTLMSYAQDFSFDLRSDDRFSVNRYGFDIENPQEWQLYQINLREDQVINQYRVASFELDIQHNDHFRHFTGVQWQDFLNDRAESEYNNADIAGPVGDFYQHTPGNYSAGPGPSGLPQSWVVGRHSVIDFLGLGNAELERDPLQQRQLEEYTWSAWWQTSYDFWQWPWPLRGDLGLRYSATHQQVHGRWSIDSDTTAVNTRRDYADWLPAVHLVMQARDDVLLRFGYRRDLARPSIDDLTSPLQLRSSARLVEGGNTQLQPSRAHSFDVSADWYGDEQQFISAGLFYKRIDSLIVAQVEDVTLEQLPYYNPLWNEQPLSDGLYAYRRPVNGPGTDISGLELNLQLPFYFLPEPLHYIGIQVGYGRNRGLVRYPLDGGVNTLPAPGLSRHVVNSELWFRRQSISAGLTLKARSRYLTRVPGANDNDREGVNAALIAGAYLRWKASPQLTFSLDARNLTNEPFDLFVDKTNRVYSYSTTGTEILAGISLNFSDH